MAVITSEGVLKHILDLKGSSVKDLQKYSGEALKRAAATVAIASTVKGTMKDLENIDNDYKNKLAKDEKKNIKGSEAAKENASFE